MKAVIPMDKIVKEVKDLLMRRGIKVYDIKVVEDDEDGVFIEAYTNIKSAKRAVEIMKRLRRLGLENDDLHIMVYPK